MSRNRFEGLMAFLHIVDSSTEQALVQSGDKLAKVHSLNDQLVEKCQMYYQPDVELSIDERMIRSKARFSFKQYIYVINLVNGVSNSGVFVTLVMVTYKLFRISWENGRNN